MITESPHPLLGFRRQAGGAACPAPTPPALPVSRVFPQVRVYAREFLVCARVFPVCVLWVFPCAPVCSRVRVYAPVCSCVRTCVPCACARARVYVFGPTVTAHVGLHSHRGRDAEGVRPSHAALLRPRPPHAPPGISGTLNCSPSLHTAVISRTLHTWSHTVLAGGTGFSFSIP